MCSFQWPIAVLKKPETSCIPQHVGIFDLRQRWVSQLFRNDITLRPCLYSAPNDAAKIAGQQECPQWAAIETRFIKEFRLFSMRCEPLVTLAYNHPFVLPGQSYGPWPKGPSLVRLATRKHLGLRVYSKQISQKFVSTSSPIALRTKLAKHRVIAWLNAPAR